MMKKYRLLSFLLTAMFSLSCCPQGIASAAESADETDVSFAAEETGLTETTAAETDLTETTAAETDVTEATAAGTDVTETTAAGTNVTETTAAGTDLTETTAAGTGLTETTPAETETLAAFAPETDTLVTDLPETSTADTSTTETEEEPFWDYPYDRPFYDPYEQEDPFDDYEPFADYPYDVPFAYEDGYDPYEKEKYYDPEDPWGYNPYLYIYPYYDWDTQDIDRRLGDDITWTIKDDTLYLEGSGAMWSEDELKKHVEDSSAAQWIPYAFNISNLVIDDNITEIADNAFYSNDKFEKIHLPANLKRIGNYAFQDCTSLKTISFPDGLAEIGSHAFSHTMMQTVALPESVVKLEEEAFSDMPNLKTVELPEGLAYLGKRCFLNCDMLINITVPDTVGYVGSNVFDGCLEWFRHQTGEFSILGDGYLYKYLGKSVNVQIPKTVKHICNNAFTEQIEEELYNWYSDSDIVLRHETRKDIEMITIPETVSELPAGCFMDMTGLKTVILPEHLDTIPAQAFLFCENLDHVVLPESVETIELGAFDSCYALTDILIPDCVTFVGRDAFKGTTFLKKLGEYAVVGDGLLIAYQGKDSILNIPEGIKAICTYAISGENITEVTLPSSMRRILENGIRGRSLVKVNMNDGLAEIGYNGIVFSEACKSVRLPDSVNLLSDESIRAAGLKYVYGSEKSQAKVLAEKRNAEYLTEEPTLSGKNMMLDLTKDVWSFGNNGENFDSEYYLTDRDRELVKSFVNPRAKAFPDKWSGDCFGLALTVVLAKNGKLPAAAFQDGAKNLHDLKPDKAVQSLINYYHCVQYADKYTRANITESKAQRFYRMIQTAENISKGESPFLMSFQTSEFAHAVVGYGAEHGSWEFNGTKYDSRVLIWDPNFPSYLAEDACLYYDKVSFSYCIPHYDIYVDHLQGTTGILQVLNDLSILNANPYPYTEPEQPEYALGDVNGDGQITVSDAVMLARIAAEDTTLKCDSECVNRADMDANGSVTMTDCTILLKILTESEKKAS